VKLPLVVSSSDPLNGGFAFQATTNDGVTSHPGVDLNAGAGGNADCGLRVDAAVHGTVVHVIRWDNTTTGFGNHVWIAMDDADPNGNPATFGNVPSHAHYCHLHTIAVKEGDEVWPDTQIGTCGRTGNWEWCHLHFEIMRHAPPTPEYWPTGSTPGAVSVHYHNPLVYLAVYQPKTALPGRPPAPTPPPAPALTVSDVLAALRLANWQKHEMEAYIVDPAHRKSVDDAAAAERQPPIVLMLRWARDHYKAGHTPP
jgi:murein DD-endopeptidase MepM/ murein hydrolase activator NlpD